MMKFHYNNFIKVVSWEGSALGQGKMMASPQWNQFRDRVKKLLDIIEKTSTGQQLFSCMSSTGRIATIFSGDPGQMHKSIAKKDPDTEASGIAATVAPFRPAQKNVPLTLKGTKADYQQAKQKEKEFGEQNPFKGLRATITQQMVQLKQPTTMAEAAPELSKVLHRSHLGLTLSPALTKNRFMNPWAELPKRLNIAATEFHDMVSGFCKIPDDVYYSLSFLLYDYLTPGKGVNAQIRLADAACFAHDFKNDIKSETLLLRGENQTAPLVEAVVLAHELVHAWRMMAGRRVVVNGWEEEAMTAGVGPFAGWKMTENSFRTDLKLKTRKKYVDNTCSAEIMIELRDSTNTGHYKGIRF